MDIYLDEDLENQLVEGVMIFALPTVVYNLLSDIDETEYHCLLLSVVEPATGNTPTIFQRIGALSFWEGEAFVKSQDGHEGGFDQYHDTLV